MVLKPNSIYHKIYKYQNNRCFYCKDEVDITIMEREHVFPRSKGGKGITNKVLSCPFCNKIKRNLTIEDFKKEVKILCRNTDDVNLIRKYRKIMVTLQKLLNGQIIRNRWHKKAKYKLVNVNKIPVINYE